MNKMENVSYRALFLKRCMELGLSSREQVKITQPFNHYKTDEEKEDYARQLLEILLGCETAEEATQSLCERELVDEDAIRRLQQEGRITKI